MKNVVCLIDNEKRKSNFIINSILGRAKIPNQNQLSTIRNPTYTYKKIFIYKLVGLFIDNNENFLEKQDGIIILIDINNYLDESTKFTNKIKFLLQKFKNIPIMIIIENNIYRLHQNSINIFKNSINLKLHENVKLDYLGNQEYIDWFNNNINI